MSLPCRCRKSTVHNVAKVEQDYTFATLGATILGVDSRCSLLIDRCLCLLSTVRPGRSLIMISFVIVIFCSTLPLRQTLRMRFTSAPDERPGTCPTKGSPLRKELSMFCLSWQGRSVETGMILVLFSALFIWNLLVCCILFQGHHGNSFRCSAYTTLCRLHTSHVDYQGRQRWDRCTFLVKWFLIEWRTNFVSKVLHLQFRFWTEDEQKSAKACVTFLVCFLFVRSWSITSQDSLKGGDTCTTRLSLPHSRF